MSRARWYRSAVVVLAALLAACATDSATPVENPPPGDNGPWSNGPIGMSARSMDSAINAPYIDGNGMTLSVQNGNPGTLYFWTVTGLLPPGLSATPADNNTLSNTLRITGTPTAAGPFTIQVTVHASDHALLISAVPFVITIGGAPSGPPAVTPLSFTWAVGTPQKQTLLASGGQLPYLAWSANGLPAGIALDPSSGDLSGTPSTPGEFKIAVTVTDSAGQQDTENITLTVVSTTGFTITGSLKGTVNTDYDTTFSVPGSTNETLFFWTVSTVAGPIPPGLTFTPANNATPKNTLQINGRPSTAGQYPLKVTVHASDHSLLVSEVPVTIIIENPAGTIDPPEVTPLSFTWVVSVASQQTLAATGGTGDYDTWSATPLPAGVTLNTSTGDLAGAATNVGTYPITVTVTDSAGNQGTGTVTLTVISISLAPYEGVWTGVVQGGPHDGKRLALFLDQAGQAEQATLGGESLAPTGNPIQFTYEVAPPEFVGLNASLRQADGRPVDWHLVCRLNALNSNILDCEGHAASGVVVVNGIASLTKLPPANPANPDPQLPTVTSSVPANGDTGVTATQVTVVFSELMSGTGAGPSITLSGGTGGALVGFPSYTAMTNDVNDVASRTLTIPLSGLESDTTYTLTLNPGVQTGFIDLAGNRLATTPITFRTQAVVVNLPPTATPPGPYTAVVGTPLAITLAGSDPENETPLTYTVVRQPTNGNLTPTGTTTSGNRTYTPAAAGADFFTYYVTDPLGAQSPLATVNITVQAPPVAFAQSVAVTRDTAQPITLLGEAEPGFTITAWTVVSGPSNGQLTPASGSSRTYTPNASYTGPDSFAFTVTDSRGLTSAPATVTLSVTAPPSPGLTANSQSIVIRRRQLKTLPPQSQWAITLTGSASAVRFKIVKYPLYQDRAVPIEYVVGQTYQTGVGLPTVTATTSSIVPPGPPFPEVVGQGDVTVSPAGSPSIFVFTPYICHIQDFGQDSFDFVAIDANGAESAPATVTITVSSSTSCSHI